MLQEVKGRAISFCVAKPDWPSLVPSDGWHVPNLFPGSCGLPMRRAKLFALREYHMRDRAVREARGQPGGIKQKLSLRNLPVIGARRRCETDLIQRRSHFQQARNRPDTCLLISSLRSTGGRPP